MNFLDIEEKYSGYDNSKVVILPVPYEETTSYGGGTENGPREIIEASSQVEFYDDEFDRELCFDIGIHTDAPIDFSGKSDEVALKLIRSRTEKLINDNKFVVAIGGEHTISQATIAPHVAKYPGLSILQFDAHSDLRDTYEGTKYSHACVMARVAEFIDYKNITQVGIRAQAIEEAKLIKEQPVNTFYASAIRRGLHGENWQQQIVDILSNNIYITFDVDYFDPSLMPTTGTPVPDGLFYNETLEIFRKIVKAGKKIVGFDVVELSPVESIHHTNFTCAQLIYKLLNYAFIKR